MAAQADQASALPSRLSTSLEHSSKVVKRCRISWYAGEEASTWADDLLSTAWDLVDYGSALEGEIIKKDIIYDDLQSQNVDLELEKAQLEDHLQESIEEQDQLARDNQMLADMMREARVERDTLELENDKLKDKVDDIQRGHKKLRAIVGSLKVKIDNCRCDTTSMASTVRADSKRVTRAGRDPPGSDGLSDKENDAPSEDTTGDQALRKRKRAGTE